jgi:tRNA G10  N-methylase Trm11
MYLMYNYLHMSQSICILGRQPALGLAELESRYGASSVQPAGPQAALLDIDPSQVQFNQLGGSLRLAKVLTHLDTTDWNKVEQYLRKTIRSHLQYVPEGKFKLGLSAYGFSITPAKLNATALTLKKTVKNSGRSVRVVPNNELELNSAQVLHNGLTSPTGCEFLLIKDGAHTWIAQTVSVQDIDAYAARDQGRPKRDARVGMLPPKLAQIIVNLAIGSQTQHQQGPLIDPFCGTGVLLQEALLMGIDVYGSDIDPRMVEYSTKNLDWLKEKFDVSHGGPYSMWSSLQVADAATVQLTSKHTVPIQFVACETYLGRPFTTSPDAEILSRTISDCNQIIKKFLVNIQPQLPANARLCIAVPAWQIKPGQFKSLPLIDHLSELGYNRVSFEHVRSDDLRYYRADQIVARQLLILTKR